MIKLIFMLASKDFERNAEFERWYLRIMRARYSEGWSVHSAFCCLRHCL